MEYISRELENIVKKSAQTFKAVLVTGARQTGKSTLLRKMFPAVTSVTFDDPFMEEQAKQNPDMFMMLHEPPVYLDDRDSFDRLEGMV